MAKGKGNRRGNRSNYFKQEIERNGRDFLKRKMVPVILCCP